MINLKEVQENDRPEISASPYSYGSTIDLDSKTVEALGLNGALAAGQKVSIQAMGIVIRRSEELGSGEEAGSKDTYVCIQLTDIDVKQQGKADTAAAATMLYGDDD